MIDGFAAAEERSRKARQDVTRDFPGFYIALGAFTGLFFGVLLGAGWFADGYWTNIYTEGLSIVLTVVIIGAFSEWRARKRLKDQLIAELRGGSNDFAKNAFVRLRMEGWITGDQSILRRKSFRYAKWSEARLAYANLQDADLSDADLTNAHLYKVNLKNAILKRATLRFPDKNKLQLESVNMSGADLLQTQMDNSYISNCILDGANLSWANLSGSTLINVNMRQVGINNWNYSKQGMRGIQIFASDFSNATFNHVDMNDSVFNPTTGNNSQTGLRTICVNMRIIHCQLKRATLNNVDFRNAVIKRTDFQSAVLKNVNFMGAKLEGSLLLGATVHDDCQFDKNTILPDGTFYDIQQGIEQLRRFTDPEHPKFQEPDWIKSQQM